MRPLATFLLLAGSLLLGACNLEPEDSGPLLELTLDFGAHPVADYLAKGSALALTYEAQRPEEQGVAMDKRAACGRYELLRPFTCQKYTSPALRQRDIRPADLSWISPSRLRLRVPEGLAGPGAYSLTQIYLHCPPQSCGEYPRLDEWRLELEPTAGAPGTSSGVLPGMDAAHSVIVGATGRLRLLPASHSSLYPPSAQAYTDWLNLADPAAVFALQDARGHWHLDDQSTLLHPGHRTLCNPGDDELSAAERKRLGWGGSLKLQLVGELSGNHMEPPWPQGPAHGCIAVEARGSGDSDYVPTEQRNYALRQGRLVQMTRFTGELRESWRFDEQGRVDLHLRQEYRDDGEDRLRFWSRTAQAAWPEYVSSAPDVDHAELQRQANEALEIARRRELAEAQNL